MLKKLFTIRNQFGSIAVLQFLTDRLARRLANLSVSRILWLSVEQLPPPRPVPEGYTFRFLTPEEVAHFATDPENDLEPWLVERAFRGNDHCFAALAGDRLASYGWYALHSIEPEHFFGVGMSYPADSAYMYAGFTHPDFRGQRLHAIGMELALRGLHIHGVRNLMSYVDWVNWPSLRSCQRLGYEDLGAMLIGRIGPWRIQRFPAAALQRGVKFGAQADHSQRAASPEPAEEAHAVA